MYHIYPILNLLLFLDS